ncbi:CmcI family methyltransferase [Pseudogemmobacter bohemicus]|uniref:CmcI family methyltransferase n=1 Tax=Pseudogemmobacter bohemicus TaxID=2250708 RepID=UPI000DD4A73E|nr:CmcI family methyltransferase [Pseudogemmobacter bohemicus]
MSYSYRGRPMWKCPMDTAIYADILWEIRPKTVIEFGSNRGASALWLADQLTTFGVANAHVWSLDINPVTDLADPGRTFGFCEVANPAASLGPEDLQALPKRLLMIDDASPLGRHVLAVLQFIDLITDPGDYVIIEDDILNQLGWEEEYQGGPLEVLRVFLAGDTAREAGPRCQIYHACCDIFGRNVTLNPERYLRRL